MENKKIFGTVLVLVLLLGVMSINVSSQSSSDSSNSTDTNETGAPEGLLENVANETGSNVDELKSNKTNLSEVTGSNEAYGTDLEAFEIQGQSLGNDSVFAISPSGNVGEKDKKVVNKYARSFISFGYSGQTNGSRFLDSSSGVKTSKDRGYVMTRSGSITGISSMIDDGSSGSELEVNIYKNGEEVGLRNYMTSSSGLNKDVDVQSKNILKFDKGDVLSVEVNTDNSNSWSDASTSVEVIFE